MDVMSLMATIGLDDSSFVSGLTGARSMFGDFKDLVGKGISMTVDVMWDFGKGVMDAGLATDKEMAAVQAVLGIADENDTIIKDLRTNAYKNARESIFTVDEAAKAYYYMGMAGWEAQDMINGLPGIMNLAAASGEDLKSTSDIVTDSLTAFGWESDRVTDYVDILAQTARNANTDVWKMGQSFKYIAPVAGVVGADVEDIAVAIGIMADQSVKGSQAGTSLRRVFLNLANPAGKAIKTLNSLGVEVFDSTGKMRDWNDIVVEARAAWKDLTDQESLYYAESIAGKTGSTGWLALMNATDQKYKELYEDVTKANGAAKEMADTRVGSNLYGDLTMLNSAVNSLFNVVYDEVKGPMREIVQWGTDAIRRVSDAISEDGLEGGIRQLGEEIEDAGEKFGPMLKSLGTALGPLFQALFESVLPAILDTSISVGTQFAEGFFTGVADILEHSDNPILRYLGNTLSQGVSDAKYWHAHDMSSGAGSLTSMGLAAYMPSTVELKTVEINGVEVNAQEIQKAIDEAGDGYQVKIGGGWIDRTYAEQIRDELGGIGNDATNNMFGYLWQMADINLPNIAKYTVGLLSGAGDEGGFNLFNNVGLQAFSIVPNIASYISGCIGESGTSAGYEFGNRFQSALNQFYFSAGVNISTNFLNSYRRYAAATNEGRILNGATVFGVDSAGRSLIGGEAGQEAVIGTRSLQRMIYDSTRQALSNVGGTTVNINITQQPGQSAAELAQEVQREFIRIERERRTIYA